MFSSSMNFTDNSFLCRNLDQFTLTCWIIIIENKTKKTFSFPLKRDRILRSERSRAYLLLNRATVWCELPDIVLALRKTASMHKRFQFATVKMASLDLLLKLFLFVAFPSSKISPKTLWLKFPMCLKSVITRKATTSSGKELAVILSSSFQRVKLRSQYDRKTLSKRSLYGLWAKATFLEKKLYRGESLSEVNGFIE